MKKGMLVASTISGAVIGTVAYFMTDKSAREDVMRMFGSATKKVSKEVAEMK